MLDSETKKKIDDLRQILVGKLPSPESQVEQITTGLIYKFMHDLDEASVEMGGKPSFFVGEYKKYAWKKLFDPKLEGADRVKLYSEAIENMYNNPGAPELFREIFKNAYLPFKNPATLGMFLKGIKEFEYSHSEKLGDAFEYLLSKMDSQGDAGQFRTPRHIIDFIVEIVNPQKNEKILDPACGTAGFLISSFKHIQKQNSNKKSNGRLTAADRRRIGKNIVGYDISPDMTRISLVNMYLHQFATPQIHEYDTLSSEDRWNEYSDVILANPPFFSPTGGIQPHSRFGVQSGKAEVLFVDYIMEHLKPKGRAGIIVPEGIIFQTGRAYKTLRKKLVEDCLVGVISLPAGVFNPYSGVKTSILILDKELHKKTDSIFFAKVENDGFSLGAQRTASGKNDLPKIINNFKKFCNNPVHHDLSINKQTIIDSGDYSLNLSKFQHIEVISDFKTVKLESVVEVLDRKRKPLKKSERVKGEYPYYGATGVIDYVNDYIFGEQLVLVGEDGAKWGQGEQSAFIAKGKYWVNNHAHVVKPIRNKILDFYLVQVLNHMDLLPFITGVTVPKLNQANLLNIKIPLPPIKIQQEIVEELDGYQKIIDGCRQVVENYKPTIDTAPSWKTVPDFEVVKVTDYAKFQRGTSVTKKDVKDGNIPVIAGGQKPAYFHNQENREANSITISSSGAYAGFVSFHPYPIFASDCFTATSKTQNLNQKFLFYLLKSRQEEIYDMQSGGAQPHVYIRDFSDFEISLPPIKIQQKIVEEMNRYEKIVEGNRELIEIYTQKIQDRISKVWGE